ncbi:uncharacterized protein N7458_011765 [Penicillium daleae]|uniref:Uncharacterized protein n=1 Tax=Penicillium daleae TaxID=63821 RepID=A0AAD6BVQ4_9EURO|nr:uncharacterized protein N7458_011765 [Penicillium daleae]KAJ5432609.1 hypothetical protein N7458_011765 [Penicillium daleae]
MMDTKGESDYGTKSLEQTHHVQDTESNYLADNNATNSPKKMQLNAFTLLCMGFVICNSWAGISASLQLALLQGGPVTLVYSIIISTTAYFAIAASLGELASVYPTAGGQYHFASILAPPSIRRGISYACGILGIFSWVAISVSVTILIAETLMAVVAATHEGFVVEAWHIFLVYEALAFLAFIYNVLALKRAPWTHIIGFFLTISIFLISFVSILARSHEKQPSSFVWVTFINETGWSDGVCFLSGLSTSCYMYIGLDAAMHMAEECTEPEKTVPRTMLAAIGIGFVTGFAYAVAVLYGITDIEEIMTTTGWIPYLVNVQTLRSTTMANAFATLAIIMAIFIIIASQEASSRLAWSFARDDGLLLSKFMQRVHPKLDVPIYSLILSWSLVFICGLIYLGSSTAITALIGSAVILQQLSFVIPIILLLYQKRSKKFLRPKRAFKLPDIVGWIANIYVVVFCTVTLIFFNFPIFIPTTSSSMNYTCVILGIALVLGFLNWLLHARRYYHGPVIDEHAISH